MTEFYNLKEELDKFLDEKEFDFKERDYFYASELGQSKKDIYDKIVNKKPFKADARVKRILENGNKMHERYIKLFAEMGILVCAEIDAVNNDLVHGRLDCIITDRKKNYIVELKSVSQWTFQKLKEPPLTHLLQIQFYMYYTNIEKGILLYENKDNQSILTFNVTLNKKLVENYIDELRELKNNIINKIEPNEEIPKMEELKYGA